MRLSASEKAEIIRIAKRSKLGVNQTLRRLNIHKQTFYNWYHRWLEEGQEGLEPKRRTRIQWNSLPQDLKNLAAEVALDAPELSPREVATKITDDYQLFISESSAYWILKSRGLIEQSEHRFMAAADEFKDKTHFVS